MENDAYRLHVAHLFVRSKQREMPSDDELAANRARFELELEFVQSLANPYYLHSLAQQNILEQPAFINYLAYLQYFREKDYARFIQSVQLLKHSADAHGRLATPMLFTI